MLTSERFKNTVKKCKTTSLAVENLLDFNYDIIELATKEDNEPNSSFFQDLKLFKDSIIKIKQDRFAWDENTAKKLKLFLKDLGELKDAIYLQFGNIDFLREKFPLENFMLFVQVNYGRIGGSKVFDETIRAHTNLLRFFYYSFLKKDLVYSPCIKTDTCFLYDPVYRQKIRIRNLNNSKIMGTYFTDSFDLKKFVYICIEQFFPNVSWRWVGGQQYAHYYTLCIILEMLEYGLWEKDDLDKLLTKVYSVSEIMYNLENNIFKDRKKGISQRYFSECKNYCTKIRELIASIFLQLIIFYLDEDVYNTIKLFPVRLSYKDFKNNDFVKRTESGSKKKYAKLFSVSFFKKKKLYTYFTFILVTYLGRYKQTNDKLHNRIHSEELSDTLNLLFNYISDINGDFFRNSLKMMKPQYFGFYLLQPNSSISRQVNSYKKSLDDIVIEIKTLAYGKLSTDVYSFLNNLKQLFKDMIDYIGKEDINNPDDLINIRITKKQEITLFQIPEYILSLLHIVTEKLDNDDKTMREVLSTGILLLRRICLNNTSAQNQIFTSYCYTHWSKIYGENLLLMHYFVKELLITNDNANLIERNKKIFGLNIKKYESLFNSFLDQFDRYEQDPENNELSIKILISVYFLNKIFSKMLEIFSNKRSKYELIIASIIYQIIPVLMNFLKKDLVTIDSSTDFFDNIHGDLNEMMLINAKFDTLPKNKQKLILYELIHSFFEIFDRTSHRFYSCSTFVDLEPLFKSEVNIKDFLPLLRLKGGVCIFKKILNIYNSFMIFSNNHLLNGRAEYYEDPQNVNGEITIEKHLFEIDLHLDLITVGREALTHFSEDPKNYHYVKFFLCSYFPVVFKLYSGLISLFIYEDYKLFYQNFEKIIEHIRELIEIIVKVKEILGNFPPEESRNVNYDLPKYKARNSINDFLENFKKMIGVSYSYDEASGTILYSYREKGYIMLKSILSAYEKFPKKYMHLRKYVRFDSKNSNKDILKTMKKTLRFNSLFIERNSKNKIKGFPEIDSYNFTDPIDVVIFIRKFYKFKKTYFFENPNDNQCFKVLQTKDILKNNISLYIDYFFTEFSTIDLQLEGDYMSVADSIYTNSNYVSLILMMDNLIKNSINYRETFYEVLTDMTKKNPLVRPIDSFKKIWDLHKDLLYFCLYKPFLDRDWTEIYTLYYLVSNFLQNLCEDNCIDFKKWFHENQDIKEQGKSMFLYYYQMFETAFSATKVYKNKTNQIILSDKPELFYILTRLSEGVTEFINGSNIYTQEIIYKYKINIWVGIILRPINEVESLFYELKWHILNYILGLTEGYDYKVIDFLATNFPVSKLYKHIVYLIKMLHTRQNLLKYSKNNTKDPSVLSYISDEQISNHKIKNTFEITDYYLKYEETFSDHVILNVVIKIYQFMRDISTKIVRYENFILEKNENVKRFVKKGIISKIDSEELYIWNFLNAITVDIELREKDNESLRIFYFKKLPVCFFLTEFTKNNFRNEVNVDTMEEKHEEFFDKTEQFRIEIEYLRRLYKKSKFLFQGSTEAAFYKYKLFLYLIAVVINILLLIFYDQDDKDFSNSRGDANIIVQVLSFLSMITSFLFLVYWFLTKYPQIDKKNWEDYYLIHPRKKKVPILRKIYVKLWISIGRNGNFQSFFLHLLFTILGMAISPFFYTLLLMLIIHLSRLVFNVALSFMVNYDKLFFTLIIILVVINSFSFLLADLYRNQFNNEEVGDDNLFVCDTYFRCLINTINLGLRGGGGVSDYMHLLGNNADGQFIGRFFFDIFFFIFINLILLGIFFGIIVDSFQEFRDKMTKRQKDIKNICFTCGLDRASLEKRGINFQQHLKIHEIWKYFFYILYLRWKPVNYYDGVDIYVSELIQDNYNDDWLPRNNCLRLQRKKN